MGLLDDAIREHLDLKRRRGADPTEIERAEREALGPVRRDPFEHGEAEPDAVAVSSEPEPAYDQAVEDEFGGAELDEADDQLHDWGDAFEDEHIPGEALDEPVTYSPEEAALPEADESVGPPPHPAEEPLPPPHAAQPVGGETAEYDVEEAFGADDAEPGDSAAAGQPASPEHAPEEGDVLEETPEFLQDTPDHDRLWFEQRPPRDFDFDG